MITITSQIRQQAKDFANLTTDSDRKAFLNTQKTEELKQKIQNSVLA